MLVRVSDRLGENLRSSRQNDVHKRLSINQSSIRSLEYLIPLDCKWNLLKRRLDQRSAVVLRGAEAAVDERGHARGGERIPSVLQSIVVSIEYSLRMTAHRVDSSTNRRRFGARSPPYDSPLHPVPTQNVPSSTAEMARLIVWR